MIIVTANAQGGIDYSDKKQLDWKAGVGARGIFKGDIGYAYLNAGIGSSVNTSLKAGLELPIYENNRSYNCPKLGIGVYGEGKADYQLKRTKAEAWNPRNGSHKTELDGGAGVEMIFRYGNFESSIGVKGGYRKNIYSNSPMKDDTMPEPERKILLDPKGNLYITGTAELIYHATDHIAIEVSSDVLKEVNLKLHYIF